MMKINKNFKNLILLITITAAIWFAYEIFQISYDEFETDLEIKSHQTPIIQDEFIENLENRLILN